jgi:hypothetical protein
MMVRAQVWPSPALPVCVCMCVCVCACVHVHSGKCIHMHVSHDQTVPVGTWVSDEHLGFKILPLLLQNWVHC